MELAKMGGRDLLTLAFIISTIASAAVAAAFTYNYYQFYPALHTVDMSVTSFQYSPTNTSLNGRVIFALQNPSSYQGLTAIEVLARFQITLPSGGGAIDEGLIPYDFRNHIPLTTGRVAVLNMPFNGSGNAPQIVTTMITQHKATQSQFIFNYTIDVYLSTFMDTYATTIISFACNSQANSGQCLQGEIALAGTGPSKNPNTGGGG